MAVGLLVGRLVGLYDGTNCVVGACEVGDTVGM